MHAAVVGALYRRTLPNVLALTMALTRNEPRRASPRRRCRALEETRRARGGALAAVGGKEVPPAAIIDVDIVEWHMGRKRGRVACDGSGGCGGGGSGGRVREHCSDAPTEAMAASGAVEMQCKGRRRVPRLEERGRPTVSVPIIVEASGSLPPACVVSELGSKEAGVGIHEQRGAWMLEHRKVEDGLILEVASEHKPAHASESKAHCAHAPCKDPAIGVLPQPAERASAYLWGRGPVVSTCACRPPRERQHTSWHI